MTIIYFRPSVCLINKCHNINSSPPFVGNGNIEFRGKEANPQINCPIQTIFCSSQTWTISLENVPRALNAMNNRNHQPEVRVYFLFAKLQQRKQASWTEYTALGFITTPHSQPHRCPNISHLMIRSIW